jgi:hypothetical protein
MTPSSSTALLLPSPIAPDDRSHQPSTVSGPLLLPSPLHPYAQVTKALQRYWAMAQQGDPKAVLILGDEASDPASVLTQWLDDLLAITPLTTNNQTEDTPPPHTGDDRYRMLHPLVLRLAPHYHETTPVDLLTTVLTMVSHVAQAYVANAYTVLKPLFTPLQLDWTPEAFRLALLSAITGSLKAQHKNDSPDQASMHPVLQRLMTAIRVDVPVVKKLTFSIKSPQTRLAQAMFDPWLLAFSGLTGHLAGLPSTLKTWMGLLRPTPEEQASNCSRSTDDEIEAALEAVLGVFDWLEETVQQCQPSVALAQATHGVGLPSVVLALPNWERIAELPEEAQGRWKHMLTRCLLHWQEKPTAKPYKHPKRRLLLLISCTTPTLSMAMGSHQTTGQQQSSDSHLFQTCRHKLLLPCSTASQQHLKTTFNSQWQQFLLRLSTNQTDPMTVALELLQACLNQPCTRWGLGFTVAQLIGQLPLNTAPQAVFNVLHHCFTLGWIIPIAPPANGLVTPLSTMEADHADQPVKAPRYQWASPAVWVLLRQQVQATLSQAQVATTTDHALSQEQVTTLTTALQQGQLLPHTTAHWANTPSLIVTLEAICQSVWSSSHHQSVLTPLNVLENWALLPPSTLFIQALTQCFQANVTQPHPLIKDYAARLSAKVLAQPVGDDDEACREAKLALLQALTEALTILEADQDTRTLLCHAVACAMAHFTQHASVPLSSLLADPDERVRRLAFTGLLTHALPPLSTLSHWVQQGLGDQHLGVVEAILQVLVNKQLDSASQVFITIAPPYPADDKQSWTTYWQTVLTSCQEQVVGLLSHTGLSANGVQSCVHLVLSMGLPPLTLADQLELALSQVFTANANALNRLLGWMKALQLQDTATLNAYLPMYHRVFSAAVAHLLSQSPLPQASALWGVLNMWDKQLSLAQVHRITLAGVPQSLLHTLNSLLVPPAVALLGIAPGVRPLLAMVCQRLLSKL